MLVWFRWIQNENDKKYYTNIYVDFFSFVNYFHFRPLDMCVWCYGQFSMMMMMMMILLQDSLLLFPTLLLLFCALCSSLWIMNFKMAIKIHNTNIWWWPHRFIHIIITFLVMLFQAKTKKHRHHRHSTINNQNWW